MPATAKDQSWRLILVSQSGIRDPTARAITSCFPGLREQASASTPTQDGTCLINTPNTGSTYENVRWPGNTCTFPGGTVQCFSTYTQYKPVKPGNQSFHFLIFPLPLEPPSCSHLILYILHTVPRCAGWFSPHSVPFLLLCLVLTIQSRFLLIPNPNSKIRFIF